MQKKNANELKYLMLSRRMIFWGAVISLIFWIFTGEIIVFIHSMLGLVLVVAFMIIEKLIKLENYLKESENEF